MTCRVAPNELTVGAPQARECRSDGNLARRLRSQILASTKSPITRRRQITPGSSASGSGSTEILAGPVPLQSDHRPRCENAVCSPSTDVRVFNTADFDCSRSGSTGPLVRSIRRMACRWSGTPKELHQRLPFNIEEWSSNVRQLASLIVKRSRFSIRISVAAVLPVVVRSSCVFSDGIDQIACNVSVARA